MSQSGLLSLPSMVAGKIMTDLGWRWVFYLLSIFMRLAWVSVLFFRWETLFNRQAVYNFDTASQDNLKQTGEGTSPDPSVKELETVAPTVTTTTNQVREPYLQHLRPYHGTFTTDPLWIMILRPFLVLLNPIVLWSCVIISFTTVWVSVELFIISLAVKNFVFSSATFFLNDWFANWGPAKMFNTIGGIQLALSLTTIRVDIYGKSIWA